MQQELIGASEFAREWLGIKPESLYARRSRNPQLLPPVVKIGRRIYFRRSTVIEWLDDDAVALVVFDDGGGPGREHEDTVGQKHRPLDVVGDEDYRLLLDPADLEELILQELAGLRIECAEGLVHQQDIRVRCKTTRQSDPLPLAPRELMRIGLQDFGRQP